MYLARRQTLFTSDDRRGTIRIMEKEQLKVLYGKLEGAGGIFARDPTGYLALEVGIYETHGLEVSWEHVQGTEERYRRLESGEADVSFVVGRASLQHFLDTGTTCVIGSSMNRCPYVLVADATIHKVGDLKGKSVACRETTANIAPLQETLTERAALNVGADVELVLLPGDQHAYEALVGGSVPAALMPRPFAFLCEEKGFRRVADWPEIVDDPLPITIETLAQSVREREPALTAFLAGHREAVGYLKTHRAATLHMLEATFGYAPSLAVSTYDDYLVWLDEQLTVEPGQVAKLLEQIKPGENMNARDVASRWVAPWGLRRAD